MIQVLDEARIRIGMDALAASDTDVAELRGRIGDPPPRIYPRGFATLLQIMTAQQISTHAAAAIWRRIEAAAGATPDHHWISQQTVEALRACGVGFRKIEHAQGLAAAVHGGTLRLDDHHAASDQEVAAEIMALRGFGRWSADIYLPVRAWTCRRVPRGRPRGAGRLPAAARPGEAAGRQETAVDGGGLGALAGCGRHVPLALLRLDHAGGAALTRPVPRDDAAVAASESAA